MRVSALILCLLAMTACSEKSPVEPSPIDRELRLAPGQTTAVPEAGLSIRFDRVSGDSRCPADAVCVQGGDALVEIDVLAAGGRQAYQLHTGNMRPVSHGDVTIALVELSPYPFSSRTIEPGEYRATLRVTR